MVKIKMLRNKHGSPNGHTVEHYLEGQEYEVPESLAKSFIEEHVAEAVGKQKAEPAAPENKADKVAKNKAAV